LLLPSAEGRVIIEAYLSLILPTVWD
jgi:hypothetical protein